MKFRSIHEKHDYIVYILSEIGIDAIDCGVHDRVMFVINNHVCTFFVEKEWLTGKSVVDGKGIEHLMNQVKYNKKNSR